MEELGLQGVTDLSTIPLCHFETNGQLSVLPAGRGSSPSRPGRWDSSRRTPDSPPIINDGRDHGRNLQAPWSGAGSGSHTRWPSTTSPGCRTSSLPLGGRGGRGLFPGKGGAQFLKRLWIAAALLPADPGVPLCGTPTTWRPSPTALAD